MADQEIQPQTVGQENTINAAYYLRALPGTSFFEAELTRFGRDLKGLVYSKWLRSYRYGNEQAKLIPPDIYWPAFQQMVKRVLCNPDCIVKFATLAEDEDVILGFSVSRNDVLDYVYVHKDVRGQGIAQKLLPPKVREFTHMTKLGAAIYLKKFKAWRFNPFV